MYQLCKTSFVIANSSRCSWSTLCASKKYVYYCLNNTDVYYFLSSLLFSSCAWRIDPTPLNKWCALSSDFFLSVSASLIMTVCIKVLHLVRNSTSSVFSFSICFCIVWFLVDVSLVSATKSWSNSPSLSFGVLTIEVDPNCWRWITVGTCCGWWCSFFLFSFLLVLCLELWTTSNLVGVDVGCYCGVCCSSVGGFSVG